MKKLQIKRLSRLPEVPQEVGRMMDAAGIAWEIYDHVNWADRYPSDTVVNFRIAHTGSHILLEYHVENDELRAEARVDGGKVWEDACCEFFIFDETTHLYNNIECNCIGTLLMAVGPERNNREMLSSDEMRLVRRWASVNDKTVAKSREPQSWCLSLIIPVNLLFDRRLTDISGMSCGANFYKCGDLLPHPHFLSWNPVETPNPDFHRPDFFGQVIFEP